jgi:hypothetical protein
MMRSGAILAAAMVLVMLVGCPGSPRYSDHPEAARIQALTDFCIGYGALRDAATYLLTVDKQRDTPQLPHDLVEGYAEARSYIRPYCSKDFDPKSAFSLESLEKELTKIRLLLLEKEKS